MRLLLAYANVPYEDERIKSDQWKVMKTDFPSGGLPCWEEDGMRMNETNALMRYLSKTKGYHPKDPEQAWDVDATFDMIYGSYFGKMKKPEVAEDMVNKLAAKLDKSKTKFLCGDKITTPDVLVGAMVYQNWRQYGATEKLKSDAISIVEANASVTAYLDRLEKEFKPYLSTRKTYDINPQP